MLHAFAAAAGNNDGGDDDDVDDGNTLTCAQKCEDLNAAGIQVVKA